MPEQPSRKQIRKAAKLLRTWWFSPDPPTEDVGDAWELVSSYRASFQRPLDMVTIQLRRFVTYESPQSILVAQRLKRLPTILDKLGRHPSMDITRMQDIGGCRAVLPTSTEVDQVLRRIVTHWTVDGIDDYITDPKSSGYRAIHVVVSRYDRLIEIQLRTQPQHEWAVAVERVGARLGVSVKDGNGPDYVLRYFEMAGHGIALAESGKTADDAFVAEFQQLERQVSALLNRMN